MNKGINMITKKVEGFKLTNSISFGESMIYAGFILKTIKVDPNVKINCTYPQRN
jgi:predicted fused transcriptional regulator/phosphomethylpyrimidine kinase